MLGGHGMTVRFGGRRRRVAGWCETRPPTGGGQFPGHRISFGDSLGGRSGLDREFVAAAGATGRTCGLFAVRYPAASDSSHVCESR